MGATFAVSLPQRATVVIMRRSGWGKSFILPGAERYLRGGMGSQMPYIDDCNSIGTSARVFNMATSPISTTLQKFGLPVAPHKTQWASPEAPFCALELWWLPSGVITPRPAMTRRLRRDLERFLLVGGVQRSGFRSLVQSFCLLRRGLSRFSIPFLNSSGDKSSKVILRAFV